MVPLINSQAKNLPFRHLDETFERKADVSLVTWRGRPLCSVILAAVRMQNTSEECEFADWVTEVHLLLKMVKVHDVLEDILEV